MIQDSAQLFEAMAITAPSYFNHILFQEKFPGFSIKRNYPNAYAFKPSKSPNGISNKVATFWVVLREPLPAQQDKRLTVEVRSVNLWKQRYLDYDFTNPDCPTEESIKLRDKSPKPTDLIDTYFYREGLGFVDKKGTVYTGNDILNRIYQEHCDTVHWLKGLELKFKVKSQKMIGGLLGYLRLGLEKIAIHVFKHNLIAERDTIPQFSGYKKIEPHPGITFQLWGINASKPAIVLASLTIVTISVLEYVGLISSGYVDNIKSNQALLTVHAILLVTFFEMLPSYFFLPAINFLIKIRWWVLFKQFSAFSYKQWMRPLLFLMGFGLTIAFLPKLSALFIEITSNLKRQ